MSKPIILKNTTGSAIELTAFGLTIPAGGSRNVSETPSALLRNDSFLESNIVSGNIVVNDGTQDITAANGFNFPAEPQAYINNDVTFNPVFGGRESIRIPDGTTAQRPLVPIFGDTRFNTSIASSVVLEIYDGVQWVQLYDWDTIQANSGSIAPNAPDETLQILGTGGVTTSASGNIITIDGTAAGASVQLIWQFDDSIISSDPGSGNFRLDAVLLANVTEIYISEETENGSDVTNLINALESGNRIYIQEKEDATRFLLAEVTSVTDNGSWFTIGVNIDDSGGITFDDGEKHGFLLLYGGSNTFASATKYDFFADQVEYPLIGSDWTVANGAPASRDTNNVSLTVRRFDDTAEEGIGFFVVVPPDAEIMTIRTKARAETAPGAAQTAVPKLYKRNFPDDGTVSVWTSNALTNIALPTNENWQYDETTDTLTNWGLTAGLVYQMEVTRDTGDVSDNLTGDLTLWLVEVEFR